MQTLLEVLQKTAAFFQSKGIENARLNAELLFAHVLKCKRLDLYLQFERPLTEAQLDALRPLVRSRAQHEPLQYVLGETQFIDLTLKTDRRALIPRPETEELVELVVSRWKQQHPGSLPLRILDLGTGTGAIALALLQAFPAAEAVAVDFSGDALALAQENAVLNALSDRISFVESDWIANVPTDPPFDVVVSNPPYLTEEELQTAAPEVRQFEPHAALVAAKNGLADLETIISQALPYLAEGALLACETGIEQHDALRTHALNCGFERFESCPDASGRPRFVVLGR